MSPAEAAGALELLLQVGIQCRAAGWCVGALDPAEVAFTAQGPKRVHTDGGVFASERRLRSRVHVRQGHDAGCFSVGIPRQTLHLFLAAWVMHDAAAYLGEGIDEVIHVIGSQSVRSAWSVTRAAEEVRAAFESRLSGCAPVNSVPGHTERHAQTSVSLWIRAAWACLVLSVRNRGFPRSYPPPGDSSPG